MSSSPHVSSKSTSSTRCRKRRFAKIDNKLFKFSKFDGDSSNEESLLVWIRNLDTFFEKSRYSNHSKIRFATLHLDKYASLWWATMKSNHEAASTWHSFKKQIKAHFL
ncbi:hypothetical protein O6H91_Y005800 [Diphasiastrum complanatum]|nr:hypothetical protein O6H91_Y005800 [Diphasiastrum complanatum]